MTKNEKEVLHKLVNHRFGLLSPSDLISGLAGGDRRIVENLIAGGYIEEVPQDVNGGHRGTYSINFYRATEKGLIKFKPFYRRVWFDVKKEPALYIGIGSIFFGLLSSVISWYTFQTSLEANKINKEISELEYNNSQPFLVIVGGNAEGSNVSIQNAGGGTAKNIFLLKQYKNAEGVSEFFITQESNIGLALVSGGKGSFNLTNQAMRHIVTIPEVRKLIPCLDQDFFNENPSWIAVFFENSQGRRFVNRAYGSGNGYLQALDTRTISCEPEKDLSNVSPL